MAWNFGEVILAAMQNQEKLNQEREAQAQRMQLAQQEHADRLTDQEFRLNLATKERQWRREDTLDDRQWRIEQRNIEEERDNPLEKADGYITMYPKYADRFRGAADAHGMIRSKVASGIVDDVMKATQIEYNHADALARIAETKARIAAMAGKTPDGKKTAAQIAADQAEALRQGELGVMGFASQNMPPTDDQFQTPTPRFQGFSWPSAGAPTQGWASPNALMGNAAQGGLALPSIDYGPDVERLAKNTGLLQNYLQQVAGLPAVLDNAMIGDVKKHQAYLTDDAYRVAAGHLGAIDHYLELLDKGYFSDVQGTGQKILRDQLWDVKKALQGRTAVNDAIQQAYVLSERRKARATQEGKNDANKEKDQ